MEEREINSGVKEREAGTNVIHLPTTKKRGASGKKSRETRNRKPGIIAQMDSDLRKITAPGIRESIEAQLQELASEPEEERFSLLWDDIRTSYEGIYILFFFLAEDRHEVLAKYLELSHAPENEKAILKDWLGKFAVLRRRFQEWEYSIEGRVNPWENIRVQYGFSSDNERILVDITIYGDNGVIFHSRDFIDNLLHLTGRMLDYIDGALTAFSGQDEFLTSKPGQEMYRILINDIDSSIKSLKAKITAK